MSAKSFDKVLLEKMKIKKELKKLQKMEEFKPNMIKTVTDDLVAATGIDKFSVSYPCHVLINVRKLDAWGILASINADGKAIKSHFTCDGNSGIAKVIVSKNA
ncbi:hypothetical protein Bca4012_032676 [Brassica carinata]|uniref:(rape) hypothetical protein n=1 Tax=Brassica napus TaxID=3708 RepID=A0A816K245_BRANA|nr:unnamed protein product [Brassica napus]CAF1859664.1 unnamed protein product [Brassica napus]